MPDGGSDCCGNCIFNRSWGTFHDPDPARRAEWAIDCTLRGIKGDDAFWTYCEWFHGLSLAAPHIQFYAEVEELLDSRVSPYQLDRDRVQALVDKVLRHLTLERMTFGPVLTNGLGGPGYYGRIPWDGRTVPQTSSTPGKCHGCQSQAQHTIRISPPDLQDQLVFCSDTCYLEWWRTRHPDPPDWKGGPRIVAGRP